MKNQLHDQYQREAPGHFITPALPIGRPKIFSVVGPPGVAQGKVGDTVTVTGENFSFCDPRLEVARSGVPTRFDTLVFSP
jgi:hypothetical protein